MEDSVAFIIAGRVNINTMVVICKRKKIPFYIRLISVSSLFSDCAPVK